MPTEFTSSLEHQRQRAAENARALMEQADTEQRTLNEDEVRQFDALHEEVERLTQDIKRRMAQDAMEAQLAQMAAPVRAPGVATDRQTRSVEEVMLDDDRELMHYLDQGTMRSGKKPTMHTVPGAGAGVVLRNINAGAAERRRDLEQRALEINTDRASTDNDSSGGYLTSETMAAAVEIALKAYNGFVEAPTRKISTSDGEPMQWPTIDDTSNEGRRLAQNTAAPERDIDIENVTLNAWLYTSNMIKVPRPLLQDSRYGIPELLGSLLGTRLGRIMQKETTQYSGPLTGPTAPQGTVANSPEAIPPAIAALSGGVGATIANAAATEVDWDDIVDLEMSVDAAYRSMPSTGFMFNSNTLAIVKKLHDNQNRPIWLPGNVAGGNPATLFGYPYWLNEHMDNKVGAANRRFMLFGMMSAVILRTSLDMFIMRLDERFAEAFQSAFLGWMRYDARLLDAGTRPLKVYQTT